MPNIYNYCPFYGLQLTPLSPSLVNKSLTPSLLKKFLDPPQLSQQKTIGKKTTNKTKQKWFISVIDLNDRLMPEIKSMSSCVWTKIRSFIE